MRKIIALFMTVAMTVSCAVSAQAAGRVNGILSALEDNSQIHILYNDQIVQYDDVKPVNTEGRVMIPFRTVLESMGASVEYEDSERLVTASKGDTTIKFTLMDDTIYIDKNGVQSTITMDVPMIIVEDRTLVPIRFMSNALGMQVGWEGESETVLIMDYDDYFDGFEALAPNMAKMAGIAQPEFNKEYMTFDFDMDLAGVNASATGKADATTVDDKSDVILTMDLSLLGMQINDAEINAVADGNKLYFKTDLFEKLSETITDEEIKNSLKMVNSNVWYSLDVNKLFTSAAMPAEIQSVLTTAVSGENVDYTAYLKSLISTEGDVDFETAIMLAACFDTYEAYDKFISVEEKTDGGYTIKMNVQPEDFDKMLLEIMGANIGDEEKAAISDMISCKIAVTSDADANKMTSDASVEISINAEGESMGIKLNMTLNAENAESVNAPAIPEKSTDITDLLLQFVK